MRRSTPVRLWAIRKVRSIVAGRPVYDQYVFLDGKVRTFSSLAEADAYAANLKKSIGGTWDVVPYED